MFGDLDEAAEKDQGRESTSPSPSASSSDHSDLSDEEPPGEIGRTETNDAAHPAPVKKSVSILK